MKNIKNTILLCLLLFSTTIIYAQSSIESILIEKHNRNAVKLYVDQPQQITADALDAKLKRSGLSGKRKKGITTYKGVILSEISANKLDIYTSVQEKGIGSLVYMAASKGYDNFSTIEDTVINNNIMLYLNSFVVDVNYRSVDIDLSSQKKNIEKQQKKYNQILDDQKDMEQKKLGNEVKLLELQNAAETKRLEIEALETELESLKTKRTNLRLQ